LALEIVTRVERVLVDGVQVDIKIVEEWGYAMGEDTCLFEEEDGSESSQTDADVGHAEQEVSHNVDLLIEKIIDVEKDGDGDAAQGQSGVKAPNIIVSNVVDSEEDGRWFEEVRSPDRNVAVLPISGGSSGGSRVARAADTPRRLNLKLVLLAGFLMGKTGLVLEAGHGVRVRRRVSPQRTVVAGHGRGAGNGYGIITMTRRE
jgi:hypothetical protein